MSKQCSCDHTMVTVCVSKPGSVIDCSLGPTTTQALLLPHNGVLAGHIAKAPLNVSVGSDLSSSKQARSLEASRNVVASSLCPLPTMQ